MLPQQYCLRWRYHHSNLQTMFSQLLDRGCFCDVTLACEGRLLRAHRVVLCACSTYFDTILTNFASERNPIIIMKDAKFADVKCLIEFMYKGEINVEHTSLSSLLKTAEELKIKGLAEVSWHDESNNDSIPNINTQLQTTPSNESVLSKNSFTQMAMPVLTPLSSPNQENSQSIMPKRKRGRPPLDDEYEVYSTPKISFIESGANSFNQSTSDDILEPKNESLKGDEPVQMDDWVGQEIDAQIEADKEQKQETKPPCSTNNEELKNEYIDIDDDLDESDSIDDQSSPTLLTQQEQEEWIDVIKMDAYLATGRRPQFWEEAFTKRVMEAIKSKELEMKKAAQILGVSYGTLYGRYRETYGCLKHPYRFKLTQKFRFGRPIAQLIN